MWITKLKKTQLQIKCLRCESISCLRENQNEVNEIYSGMEYLNSR